MGFYMVIVSISVFIAAVILGEIFCGDVTNVRQSGVNSWPQLGNANKDQPVNVQQSTTPWPALGQPRRQPTNNMPQGSSQSIWVRPSGSPTWVRSTPTTPIRGANNPNYNSNFLNMERGQSFQTVSNTGQRQNLGNQNQRTNIASNTMSPKPNQGTNNKSPAPSIPFIETGGKNNQNLGSNVMAGVQPNPGMNNKNSASSMPLIDTSGKNNQNLGSNAMMWVRPGSPNSPVMNNNKKPTANMPAIGANQYSNKMTSTISPGSKSTDTVPGPNQSSDSNVKTNEEGVEDYELREFSEELLSKDINNAARYVTINLQGKTTSRSTNDEAPLPLLSIDRAVYNISTVQKLALLYNNYIVETSENEVYTAQEKIEENNLLDAILSTPVLQHTRNFLVKKGRVGKDPKEFKDLLRLIWFNMYSRGKGRIGSSGFEHVFLAELKDNQVSGLHNWLYFNEEESKNNANYLGYMKEINLGNKGSILKYHFTFRGVDKPVGSMFIGTSPELEIALYSACFILRADRICPLKLNGNRFIIRTFTFRYRGKKTIGSAFPEI